MGAYLKGEKLDFSRNYKIIHDEIKSKIIIGLTSEPPFSDGRINMVPTLNVEDSTYFTIDYENILLSDDLNFSNISEIENISANLFSFENAYICYITVGADDVQTHILKYDDYKNVFNISFSLDSTNKQIIVTNTFLNRANTPGLSDLRSIRYGGIWGALKYNNKYVFYKNNTSIKYGNYNGYSPGFYGPNPSTPRPYREIVDGNQITKQLKNISSETNIEYVKDSSEILGYFNTTYWGEETTTGTTVSLNGVVITGQVTFGEMKPVYKKSNNRRIING